MSFERWFSRLASGRYDEYEDSPFVNTYGKRGCLFLLRVAQAPDNLEFIRNTPRAESEATMLRLQYGFWNSIWEPERPLKVRTAAISAIPDLIYALCARSVSTATMMFWYNVLDLRELRSIAGDGELIVEAAFEALSRQVLMPSKVGQISALYGLYETEHPQAREVIEAARPGFIDEEVAQYAGPPRAVS